MRQINNQEAQQSLIISYSYSGHTHQIAQTLQKLTGGDWQEIYPWQPYPMAFPELLSQARKEIQGHVRPRLLPVSYTPQPYPIIFVGTPNWCATMAPPLASWLYQNCGGVPCDLRRDIQALCPRAEVGEPLGILDEETGEAAEQIQQWLIRQGLIVSLRK